MDASLFTEDAPGKLVPVSTEYGDDWAFVPDPLPPELDLTGISKAHEEATWEEWLIFFLQAVTSEARGTIKRIYRLQELQSEWHRRLSKERASALTLRLADNLIENPIINYTLASDVLSEDYFTGRNCVNRLAESGILSDFGRRGNRKTFICEPVFDVLFYE